MVIDFEKIAEAHLEGFKGGQGKLDTRNYAAAGLCYECLNDIALDVFGMTGNDHDFEDADPLELAEIKRRWKPYIGQLPEYAYLCDELLSRSK